MYKGPTQALPQGLSSTVRLWGEESALGVRLQHWSKESLIAMGRPHKRLAGSFMGFVTPLEQQLLRWCSCRMC